MAENILTLVEQLKSSARKITRDEFIEARSRGWDINAFRWARSIDHDLFRKCVFDAVERIVDHSLNGFLKPRPKIVDIGCGEGSFLRRCSQKYPSASFIGLDVCKNLLHIANGISHRDNVVFRRADFELDYDLDKDVAIVTAIFSLIECVNLDTAFKNIRQALMDRGIAVVVVLDPMREFIRAIAGDNSKKAVDIRKLDGDLVLIPSSEPASKSAKIYWPRILYPVDRYISSANSSGMLLEAIESVELTESSISLRPRGVVMIFRAI